MPAKGAPSSGVFRLATKGATPSESGISEDSSRPNSISSSMSSSVSSGKADHDVELESFHAVTARQLGSVSELFLAGLALDDVAHALAGPVARRGEHSMAASAERGDELVAEAIGPKRRQAHLASRVGEGVDQVDDLRVIRRRGPDQAHAFGFVGDQGQDAFLFDDTHSVVRRAAHYTIGAATMTAALRLDEKHVPKLGVRRDYLRVRGERGAVGLVDGR